MTSEEFKIYDATLRLGGIGDTTCGCCGRHLLLMDNLSNIAEAMATSSMWICSTSGCAQMGSMWVLHVDIVDE